MVSGRDWLLTFLISGWRYEFEQGEFFVYGVFDTSPWHLHRMSGLRMKITGEAQRFGGNRQRDKKQRKRRTRPLVRGVTILTNIYRASSRG